MISQETILSLLPKFVQSLTDQKRSPSTALAYQTDLKQMIKFLADKGKTLPDQVQTADLESFRDTLLKEKYSAKSVSRKLNAIKTLFKWIKKENLSLNDPSAPVAHPKLDTTMPKFLSPLEYRALRDVVREDIRVSAIIELILQTGLRISEVASLKLTNITGSEISIDAYATLLARKISLNKPAKDAIDRYLTLRPKSESPFVFISKNGKPLAIRNIRAAIDRYLLKAEISQYSVNDLRTSFIVANLKAGVDLVTLSQALGHKRLSSTEKYLKLAGITDPGNKQQLIEL